MYVVYLCQLSSVNKVLYKNPKLWERWLPCRPVYCKMDSLGIWCWVVIPLRKLLVVSYDLTLFGGREEEETGLGWKEKLGWSVLTWAFGPSFWGALAVKSCPKLWSRNGPSCPTLEAAVEGNFPWDGPLRLVLAVLLHLGSLSPEGHWEVLNSLIM